MAKKNDILFDDEKKFLQDNPHFAIHEVKPNLAALRAVLRSGQKIAGVELVESEDALTPLLDGKPDNTSDETPGFLKAKKHA